MFAKKLLKQKCDSEIKHFFFSYNEHICKEINISKCKTNLSSDTQRSQSKIKKSATKDIS